MLGKRLQDPTAQLTAGRVRHPAGTDGQLASPPPRRSMMAYRVAAVDVHKKMLAVVVTDVAGEGEYRFERRKFGATPDQLHLL